MDDHGNTVQRYIEGAHRQSLPGGILLFLVRQCARGHTNVYGSLEERRNPCPGATALYHDINVRVPGHKILGTHREQRPQCFRPFELHRASLRRWLSLAATEQAHDQHDR